MIINLRKPVFGKVPTLVCEMLDKMSEILNQEQKEGIIKTLSTTDYQIIVGGPGTGKHHLIAVILLLAKVMKIKIVVFGVNHQRLDSILLRLLKLQKKFKEIKASKFVRMAHNKLEIDEKLHPYVHDC